MSRVVERHLFGAMAEAMFLEARNDQVGHCRGGPHLVVLPSEEKDRSIDFFNRNRGSLDRVAIREYQPLKVWCKSRRHLLEAGYQLVRRVGHKGKRLLVECPGGS